MNILQKTLYLLSSAEKRSIIILQILLLIGMVFEMLGLGLILPLITLIATPDVFAQNHTYQNILIVFGNPSEIQLLIGILVFFLLVYTVKAIFLFFLLKKQAKFSKKLSRELSLRLFNGYLFQPYKFVLNRNSAILIRNIENEISTFSSTIDYLFLFQTNMGLIVGVLLVLLFIEPLGAAFIILFFSIFGYLFFNRTKTLLESWSLGRQTHQGKRMQYILEGINGLKDIKVLGREKHFIEKFSTHNILLHEILRKVLILQGLPKIFLELLLIYGLVFLILIMQLQGQDSKMMLPTIGVLLTASIRLIPAISGLMSYGQGIKYGFPSIELLYNEFTDINTKSTTNKLNKSSFNDKLEINNLCFQYDNTKENTISNINICIKKGDFIGFVGQSGSGKSTLVDLILGLLIPKTGSIKVDNIDIHENLRSWQDQIGYVPQSIYLTDDTLKHNIAFGISDDSINEEKLFDAINSAQLDQFINDLPNGLETMVGERGVRLSGGQRQRIGIARALYHNPSVLVLDEATSSLDMETEKGVMNSINLLQRNKTIIIVAHRLSTIENCDKFYKIEKGKVITQGFPRDLINLSKMQKSKSN